MSRSRIKVHTFLHLPPPLPLSFSNVTPWVGCGYFMERISDKPQTH